jgi:hypothetical protein
MITYRLWVVSKERKGQHYRITRGGWFVFGIIPLLILDLRLEDVTYWQGVSQ